MRGEEVCMRQSKVNLSAKENYKVIVKDNNKEIMLLL
jgi:hypothetical protein